ncbi:zinc finger CCCH domain-containing protein 26-like [Raphanus sativus]|uniref:Zinc finger CCCH domain-containing protein 26 n=1 Tax=Raphanus sativus TaxID=3726 RepID=A0A6J0JEE5_RAPSA|nr:zinc finger CCCH domain-containing protein 26 [Raphanus sativus]XP_056857894.1 zinc finger CCCH domain-containing protein 26-like [Raphanus sativus]
MSETQQVQNSSGSIQSSETIEDTFRRMTVNEPYPDRPGERDCQFFLRTGQCGYGNSCRFNHPLSHLPQGVLYHRDELPERIGEPDCEYFLKTGACKYGSTCKYHHPKDRNGAGPVLFNVLGYPMRQGEKSCPYYMQKGVCRFGVACKFHHPHPNPQPHNGHSSPYGMSSFPSVGFPYGGGLTMMSLPPATYGVMPPPPPPPANYGAMPRPQVPHPQAYMPFMVAPPQGWSTYMAGTNPIYYVKSQPDSSSSASVPVGVTSHQSSLSESPECRFFMNTGTCKYGDDCKYFHPKERMLISPPNLLNHVLPARPGQPACGNFKAGFCKYGANCKFAHPLPLNPYDGTSLVMPSLPYSSPVTTHHLPSRSDSSALSNGNKPSTGTEKQDERSDKSEVQEPSQLNISDATALSNGKSDAESPSSETKKNESSDNASQLDKSGKQDSSDNAS